MGGAKRARDCSPGTLALGGRPSGGRNDDLFYINSLAFTRSTARTRHAEMVRQFCTGEAVCKALRVERQHADVPFVPFGDQTLVEVFMALLQIGSLPRVADNVEQK